MNKNIEIHILQNFAPSNLNRDDTGAPKDAFFGGTRRSRISSQCYKRAVRQYFNTLTEKNILKDQDIGVRTKKILESVVEVLINKGRIREEALQKVITALSSISMKFEENKSQYLIFLGKNEIKEIAEIINEKWDTIKFEKLDLEPSSTKKGKKDSAKHADPLLKKALEKIFNGGKALDVALFGRMLADLPLGNQHASCQVAHSISTHVVEREFDFYTAVDDLKSVDVSGADMIGTIEFSSSCFYRYANLDFNKLTENLQNDSELAVLGLKCFIEAFILSTPSGKQNSFAAQNPPEFVAITLRESGAMRNLANAFESAIRIKSNESLTKKSAEELCKKALILSAAYGENDSTFILNITGADLAAFGTEVKSLSEMLANVISYIQR